MPRPTYPLRPVELDFLDRAPVRLAFSAAVAAAPEAVYQALAVDTEGWSAWFGAVSSARPTASGRVVVLAGVLRFEETVLAADRPGRYAYRADTVNAPGLRALLEEWRVAPVSRGSLIQWTVAADGSAPLRRLLRASAPGLRRAFRGAVHKLDLRNV